MSNFELILRLCQLLDGAQDIIRRQAEGVIALRAMLERVQMEQK